MIEMVKKEGKNLIGMAGDLKSFQVKDHGVTIQTDRLAYDLLFYRSNVIRVHQYSDHQDTNPYSVIQTPASTEFTVEENDDAVLVIGEAIDVAIGKAPLIFTFLTKDGRVINQDDAGLGTQTQGDQITVYKKMQEGERFIGLGEKTGPLDRRGSGYENWNTDHFAYGVEDDPLYASIPFYMGVHNELSYGIFVDNSYKSYFNFGASNNRFSSFSAEGGDMDYYFFSGSVEEVIESYTWLTGRMNLPPIWSLGYQQCRYSYYPDTEVLNVAKNFRDKDIPADVMVLDIHHMDKYKIFSWDKERFPQPEKMVEELKELGFEVVVICDPGIKVEEGYLPYDDGLEKDLFIKYPDGTNYEGEVWPGWCNFPDFTSEKARSWWTEMMKAYTDIGVEGFWNDMNEIATWGQMLPDNILFEFEGEGATTRKARNIYGLQMSKSAYESAKTNLGGKRPFTLTRAGFSGIQRYSALWTGDNVATDDHMLLGVRMVSSLGLSGVAFSGYDVGGFVGDAGSNLFARWIQLGAFAPFFRGHSTINTNACEPWSFGEEVEEITKNYIQLRYRLMPYLYNAFLRATETGVPIARSLTINYTFDAKIYDSSYENQYLLGDAILVAPMRSDTSFNKVYLPEGDWYEFFTDEKLDGQQELIREYALEHFPLFIKSSSIIPVHSKAGRNSKDVDDKLEVHLYNGESSNSFDYYEDDGVSFDHENEVFHRRTIKFEPTKKQVLLESVVGNYQSKIRKLKLILHGFDQKEMENSTYSMQEESYNYVDPISNFDPFDTQSKDFLKIKSVFTLETNYVKDEMVFNW